MTLRWRKRQREFKIQGEFRISRGARTSARSLEVTLEYDGISGRGECVPYPRFGDSLCSSSEQIEAYFNRYSNMLCRKELRKVMPAGAARNAIDCAIWDIEAKQSGLRAWQLSDALISGATARPLDSAFTISADTPEKMRGKAQTLNGFPLLKLKLTGTNDIERIEAVHLAQPQAQTILDANESWSLDTYQNLVPRLRGLGVIMVEQPLQSNSKEVLERPSNIHLCADESVTDLKSLKSLPAHFTMINIKLDKAGGLTEA